MVEESLSRGHVTDIETRQIVLQQVMERCPRSALAQLAIERFEITEIFLPAWRNVEDEEPALVRTGGDDPFFI